MKKNFLTLLLAFAASFAWGAQVFSANGTDINAVQKTGSQSMDGPLAIANAMSANGGVSASSATFGVGVGISTMNPNGELDLGAGIVAQGGVRAQTIYASSATFGVGVGISTMNPNGELDLGAGLVAQGGIRAQEIYTSSAVSVGDFSLFYDSETWGGGLFGIALTTSSVGQDPVPGFVSGLFFDPTNGATIAGPPGSGNIELPGSGSKAGGIILTPSGNAGISAGLTVLTNTCTAATACGVSCTAPADSVIGGGCLTSAGATSSSSYPSSATAWSCASPTSGTIEVYAICSLIGN